MKTEQDYIEGFYDLSVVLTGFTHFELRGTDVGETYFATLLDIVGPDIVLEMIYICKEIEMAYATEAEGFDKYFREAIWENEKLGPVAKNLTKMWYLGNWEQLPKTWREQHGISSRDITKVVSADAYREGLVWVALAAHPMGAKPMGYGTWGMKPGLWPATKDE